MPTVLGSTIAHYKVTAALGQGDTGEVYRATDTKLDREVALQSLPNRKPCRAQSPLRQILDCGSPLP